MKKYLLSTMAIVGIFAVASTASAETMKLQNHTYVVGAAGYGFGSGDYKEDGIFGLGMGYRFDEYLRSDIIVSYRAWGKTDFKGTTKDTDTWSIPVLANVYGTLPVYENLGVYAMGGVGMAYNKTDGIHNEGKGKGKASFAWNVGGGVLIIESMTAGA